MKGRWEKAYLYGRIWSGATMAHVVIGAAFRSTLCGQWAIHTNRDPKPYPVCRNCLKTKRAKELGL